MKAVISWNKDRNTDARGAVDGAAIAGEDREGETGPGDRKSSLDSRPRRDALSIK
jgi:hypothetical protein